MTPQQVMEGFASLPHEDQRLVAEFIKFLKQRPRNEAAVGDDDDLADDEFIGMWRDREDLSDSVNWVRATRAIEWGN